MSRVIRRAHVCATQRRCAMGKVPIPKAAAPGEAHDESGDERLFILRMLRSERVVVAVVVGFLAIIVIAGVALMLVHDASTSPDPGS